MRWTQRDPLNLPTDLRQGNRYVYVGGDPINLYDPNGLFWRRLAKAACYTAADVGGIAAGTAASGATTPVGGIIIGSAVAKAGQYACDRAIR